MTTIACATSVDRLKTSSMHLFEKEFREGGKPVGTDEIYCVKSPPADDVEGYSKA